jgi:hypothetical protein
LVGAELGNDFDIGPSHSSQPETASAPIAIDEQVGHGG